GPDLRVRPGAHAGASLQKSSQYRRCGLALGIEKWSLYYNSADTMTYSLNRNLELQASARPRIFTFDCRERDHPFQSWRPGAGCRLADLSAIFEHGHGYPRSN